MRGRSGIGEILSKKDFARLYVSGKSFDEIGKMYGAKSECIKYFFLENFLGFERFQLKKDRENRMSGGETE